MLSVQTRSETTGLSYFNSVEKALEASKKDSTIWKISYTDEGGNRVRMLKQENGEWKNEPMEDILARIVSDKSPTKGC